MPTTHSAELDLALPIACYDRRGMRGDLRSLLRCGGAVRLGCSRSDQLSHGPCLERATRRRMRSVPVGCLRHRAQPELGQMQLQTPKELRGVTPASANSVDVRAD